MFYVSKTRSGVFCDQRNPGRKFPEIPNSFVYYTQVVPGSDQNTIDEGIVDSLIVISLNFSLSLSRILKKYFK